MTYTGCLIIAAIIWVLVRFICAIIQYQKNKKNFTPHEKKDALAVIFFSPLLAALYMLFAWAIGFILIGLLCWNVPVETDIRTTLNSAEQIIEFKEQDDNKIIVSIEGNEYACTKLIVSKDIERVQVKLVEHETADNFYAKFFLDEFTGHGSFYELYIPAHLIGSTCD